MRGLLALAIFAAACGGKTDDASNDASTIDADTASDSATVSDSATSTDTTTVSDADPAVATDTATIGDAGCDCLAARVSWGWDGGLVAYVDKSSLNPCRTYEIRREHRDGTGKTCTRELLACGMGDALDIGDVQAALARADVVNAFSVAPVMFGRDTRPSDGQVFRIERGGKVIEVGADCGPVSACKPIPPGVQSLVNVLRAVDAAPPCRDAIGM